MSLLALLAKMLLLLQQSMSARHWRVHRNNQHYHLMPSKPGTFNIVTHSGRFHQEKKWSQQSERSSLTMLIWCLNTPLPDRSSMCSHLRVRAALAPAGNLHMQCQHGQTQSTAAAMF
jgi:hypothetical protein